MINQTVYRARIITALLFMVLGCITLWQSQGLPFGSLSLMKSGFFPRIFGSLMTGLSIVMLVHLVLARRKAQSGTQAESDADADEEPVNFRGLLAFVGIFALFLLLTYGIGFIAASFAAVAASGYLLGLKGWRLAVLSVTATASIWLLFDVWLGISLPPGVWL